MSKLQALLEVMERLRDPQTGCPWDIRQSFSTIAPYTIEEAYEVADAIEREDNAALCDELGDLLLQVVFHAQIARELELFDFDDVAAAITEKMIRRHPHVFGDTHFKDEQEQKANWEAIKADERADKASQSDVSALDGVAVALPALTRAEKIQKRAARVGFDWPGAPQVTGKLTEELNELIDAVNKGNTSAIEEELGDLLFTVTNMARHLKLDPEQALKKSTAKFERRFRHLEAAADNDGAAVESLSADTLEQYWQQAKQSD
jgi:MazG family protein